MRRLPRSQLYLGQNALCTSCFELLSDRSFAGLYSAGFCVGMLATGYGMYSLVMVHILFAVLSKLSLTHRCRESQRRMHDRLQLPVLNYLHI
jgi:hypothetical protein